MSRAWCCGVLLVSMLAAFGGTPRLARGCTPVKLLLPEAVVSPTAGALLRVDASVLLRDREAMAFVAAGTEERLPLELQVAFEPLRPFAAPLAFYRPARLLTADADYVLHSEDAEVTVPFRTTAQPLRTHTTLEISVVSRAVPEQSLDSASCYSGPLEGRPYTRVADVTVTPAWALPVVVSVTTLDSVSGQLIEDALLYEADLDIDIDSAARLELPLPVGVADCLRVQVLDLAGAVVADEGSLCARPEGESRTVSADVFEPTPSVPFDPGFIMTPTQETEAQPNEPSSRARMSKGCALSRWGGAPSGIELLALGALLLSRRRRTG